MAPPVGGPDPAEARAEDDHGPERRATERAVLVGAGGELPADQSTAVAQTGPGGGGPAGQRQAVGVGAGQQRRARGDGVAESGVDRGADPFSGSDTTSTGKGAPAAKVRTFATVASVQPLSTTSRVKSRSRCAASARRVSSISASSW